MLFWRRSRDSGRMRRSMVEVSEVPGELMLSMIPLMTSMPMWMMMRRRSRFRISIRRRLIHDVKSLIVLFLLVYLITCIWAVFSEGSTSDAFSLCLCCLIVLSAAAFWRCIQNWPAWIQHHHSRASPPTRPSLEGYGGHSSFILIHSSEPPTWG